MLPAATLWAAAMNSSLNCSRRAIWCWAIPTPAFLPSVQNDCTSRCFTYRSEEFVRKVFYKILRESVIKSSFGSCGKNVHIAEKSDIKGIGNISIGDDVAIGPHALLWTTRANIIIKEKVIIGPGLSIITGDHKINVVGKYMADVTDEEKDDENDQDVIIEKDVWIGANVTILKGVTVAEGCVIGAGTVLTKSTHPYGIYVGVPGRRVSERFTNEELENHINILQEKSKW